MALTRPRYSQIPDSDYKNSCRIVTTTNVPLIGAAPLTYDGVTLIQYDRVLVAGQTDKTQNGIYSVSTLGSGSNGTWVRSKDANANDRLTAGMNTFIEEGTYTGQFWHLLTPGPIVLGVSELVFGQITGNAAGTSSQVQYNLNGSIAGAANLRYDSVTGNVLLGNGSTSTSNVTGALVVNGGIGVSGNINVGGNVSANKFYTTSGLFWAGNGLAFSSGLEVSEINTANTLSNISTQVTSIRFDKDTGFNVTELNPGNIKVSLGSSFKTWHVPGQADLVAVAEDEVTFFGNGIDITTNPTFPKSITFIANNSVLEANISAYQLYANANAASQAVSIDTINSNIIAANAAIQTLSANIGTLVGGASAALDTLLELGNALGNNDSFSSTVVNWLSNITANVTAANAAITTLDANVGTLFLGNASTNANLGAYQLYANANIGTLFLGNASTNANLGAFQTYANANIGTLFLGNASTQANLGAYQIYANANAASIQTQINTITTSSNANIAAFLTTYTGNIGAGNIIATGNITASYITTQGVDSGNISGVNYIYANNYVYSANGVSILAAHDANIGTLYLGNISTQANLGAFQTYANANIGTLFLGNASTNANLGAYQTYVNTSIATLDANIGTLFLGNASTNANLGAYQLYANANIGSIYNQLNALDANVGAFQTYANANIGTLFLGNASTNANLGAYQIYANANAASLQIAIDGAYGEISALDSATGANAATQAAAINALSANINAFQYYANTKIGTNNNSNLVVTSTTDSVSAITGAVVVAGGMGIGGNLYVAGNIYASNLTAISISTLSVQDPLLYLTADTTFPYNYDIGFFSHYEKVSGDIEHTGIARDYTTDIWNFFSNAITNPGATVNWGEYSLIYDTVRVGDFIVANTTPSTSTSSGALRVAGGAGIEGKLYIANTGDVSANIGTLYLGNISVNANLGAYQLYANNSISTLFIGNLSTQANLGAFQTYANTRITTLDANLGAYQLYANANIGTLFLGNADTQANLGTLFLGNISTQANLGLLYDANISTQANIGSIRNQLDTLDANVGSFESYANVYLGVSTTFTVTDSGFSEYIINGETNPALYLIRGQKYNFSINATGQPFWIKTAPSIGSGDQYNTGVVNNGEDSGIVVFEVPLTAPDVLYYVSQFDAAMTNQLRVVNFPTLDANIGTLFLGNAGTQANLGAFQTYTNTSFATLDANVGTLFLGNAGTNANLGAFQTYANVTFTTYSNANVAAYLPIYTGNITAGNVDVTGNVSASKFYTTNGIYWSGNGASYSTGGGSGITYTASTTPPVGPVVGDQWYDTVDGILYEYMDDGDTNQWVDIISPTFSGASPVAFTSNITVAGNIFIGNGIFWSANGDPYASGGGSFSGSDDVLRANVGAYQLYANANIGTLYLGNISTNANLGAFQIYANANIGTLFLGNVSTQANIGRLFLGNASTNANLGAFQAYANTKIGTNTNSNLVVVATTTSTNATTGALVVGGGVGIAGALNVSSSGSFGGLIQTTATTAATSTATGALYVAGGVGIVGNLHAGGNVILGSSTTTSNVVVTGTRTSTTTTTGALVVRGGAGIVGNVYTDKVYTTNGIFWSGNNAVFAPPATSIFSSNVVAASGTASTNTTTGALVVQGGAGISGAAYIGGDLRITSGSTSVGTTSGALVVTGGMGISGDAFFGALFQSTSGLDSTGTSQGAFTVQNGGGIGVTGNIHATKIYTVNGLYWSGNGQPFQAEAAPTFLSNLVAASGTPSTSVNTGALVVAGTGGLGVGGDLNATAGSTVNGWTVGGLLWAACTTPATSATSGGGLLVNGGARILGNVYASGNIYLGANTSSNLVANATTTSTSTTTGALVVRGGAGVAGNLYVGSEFVIPGGGKITSSGIANFLEKANVVVSAPAATINVDLSVASVMYWTSNSTTNMTANIRGDETTPLNSVLSIGQSVTTALFIPNGVSNYYINSFKIDNTTITPAYSGNTSPTLGNPDSIDIYSFTILKTADATFKVFATQSQFQHPG